MRKKVIILSMLILLIFIFNINYLEVKASENELLNEEVMSIVKLADRDDRPSSLSAFISKYNVKNMTDREIAQKIEELKNGAVDEGGRKVDITLSINGAVSVVNGLEGSKKSKKDKLEEQYEKDRKDIIQDTKNDGAFLAMAYTYAKEYVKLESEEDYGDVDDVDEEDYIEEFKKAYNDYKNASTDADRKSAFSRMQDIWPKLNEEQRKEKIDGDQTAEDIINNTAEKEQIIQNNLSEPIYKKPGLENVLDSSESLEDMMNDGDNFIKSAGNSPIKTDQLQSVSSNLYNIFVEVGVALAVIVGLIIGIKYMYSSVDEKAEIKKLLVPYLVGCVVIFGALGIWKFVVTILQGV